MYSGVTDVDSIIFRREAPLGAEIISAQELADLNGLADAYINAIALNTSGTPISDPGGILRIYAIKLIQQLRDGEPMELSEEEKEMIRMLHGQSTPDAVLIVFK